MRKRFAAALALLLLAATPAAGAAAPEVVVTVKPLHSLVAAVMAGLGVPRLLVQGAGSPHNFQMRPSDAQALAGARLVFWTGEELEPFMTRPLEALAADALVVALAEAPGVSLLEVREGGAWEGHDDEHEGQAHKGHGGEAPHGDEGHDPHLWLDPRNAAAMADAIARALAEVDAANAARYRVQAEALKRRLAALDAELEAALAPVRGKPFVVFHDAYQYLEARYRLAAAGSITLGPEVAPGARRIVEIRAKIRETGAACVFAEPQFEPRLARLALEGSGARLDVLDPLGAALTPGPELYFELMRDNAQALRRCLLTPG